MVSWVCFFVKRVMFLGLLMLSNATAYAGGGESVFSQVLRALGADETSTVQTMKVTGEIQLFGGFPGKFHMEAKRPESYSLSWDIGYTQDQTVVTGASGWQKKDSIRELVGDELMRVQSMPLLLQLLEYRAQGIEPEIMPADLKFPDSIILKFHNSEIGNHIYYVDKNTLLVNREARKAQYEEGELEVSISYSDYRKVDGLTLPFDWVISRKDMPMHMFVKSYDLKGMLADNIFTNPQEEKSAGQPYEVRLTSLSNNIYAENDGHLVTGRWYRGWGIPVAPSESWLFHVVVDEKYGRYIEPKSATITLMSGKTEIKKIIFNRDALINVKGYPAARYNNISETYNFRHSISEMLNSNITSMVYEFQGVDKSGKIVSGQLMMPVKRYKNKKPYIFPLKGRFLIVNGHEFDMHFHTYEKSQYFAYDILPLGPEFDLAKNNGAKSEDFYAFQKTEIIAPADGKVVYARNDVPDLATSAEYLRQVKDPKYAIGGNIVLIDHGDGEVSVFAHMAEGSVRVKAGDIVKQGDTIGLLGSAGSGEGLPHLHYQLQNGTGLFQDDGLPIEFQNVYQTGFFKFGPISVLKSGPYFEAR